MVDSHLVPDDVLSRCEFSRNSKAVNTICGRQYICRGPESGSCLARVGDLEPHSPGEFFSSFPLTLGQNAYDFPGCQAVMLLGAFAMYVSIGPCARTLQMKQGVRGESSVRRGWWAKLSSSTPSWFRQQL